MSTWTGGRAGAAAVAVLVLGGLLGGCVALPTGGAVHEGVDAVTEPGSVMPLGDLPALDAGPEDIVRGFLSASAAGFSLDTSSGAQQDFTVARAYLTGDARGSWNPRERVVVYPAAPEVSLLANTQARVAVTVPVSARIDAAGRYAQAPAQSEESLVFDLVQDDAGQWRISGLDDGVVLAEANFEAIFRASPVYFLSQDSTFLVPETRWFPVRNLATSVMRALIAGPSPWLRDGVRTAVPEGAKLAPDAVPVDADGVATVSLARGSLPADPGARSLLLAQVEASLRIPRVRSVQVTAEGVPLEVAAAGLQRGTSTAVVPEMLRGDRLVRLTGTSLEDVPDVAPLGGIDARSPARDEAGRVRVVLDGPDRLVTVPGTTQPSVVLLAGAGLAAPSVDRIGWVWTADSGRTGVLTAVRTDGTAVQVGADWLAGRRVLAVRISRDGSRAAVVSEAAAGGAVGRVVDVASVVRDDSGTPQQLGEALGVGASVSDPRQVVWVDESTLGVLGRSGNSAAPAYQLVPVGGPTTTRPVVADTASIAGGAGESALYLVTSGGALYVRSGPSWTVVAEGVRDAFFPG